MVLLEYENQILLDCFHEDGLLVMAKGLGIHRIFINFLKLNCDSGALVLVLNTTPADEEYCIEELEKMNVKPLPKRITTELSIKDRQCVYLEGGVLFVTSRILVVDMLTERIPTHLITGVLVYKAHKIIDSCQEAFILRLYRQKNKKGFIKAFSDSAQAFTSGFCHVERIMKSLFLRRLFLFPRFQANILATLEKHKIDVVELCVPLTASMNGCQMALLDLTDACVKEVKRCNPGLDLEEFTVENAITRHFDLITKIYLDPIWHQLGPKTKQLINDIKTLRLLIEYLTQYDCVNFYQLVTSLHSSEKQFSTNAGWLFLDAAESLLLHARHRVFRPVTDSKKAKTVDAAALKNTDKNTDLVLEESPKWQILRDVLTEVANENVGCEAGAGKVLVLAADDRTCNQLQEYLCEGGKKLLQSLYDKVIREKTDKGPSTSSAAVRSRLKPAATFTLTQMLAIDAGEKQIMAEKSDTPTTVDDLGEGYIGLLTSPVTILHPLKGCSDPYSVLRTLDQVQPRFIIMYDTDVQVIRQIEIYHATHSKQTLRVYFIQYQGSTEEQCYLTGLRKEKEAFEYLIREKSTLVIAEEYEGKTETSDQLFTDGPAANTTVNSRKGGGNVALTKSQEQRVVVDMREFRSELPSLLHRKGIQIDPVTLEVGDYLLTPEICVERKSVSDLIGSLNSGRLYNQCVSMCRYYSRPALLIEFDPNKPFTLQGKFPLGNDISSQDVVSRLTLLTIHFPRLRIFWCQSPYATAELFAELKTGREQPDMKRAMAITGETEEELVSDKYSHSPRSILLKMPGINTKNAHLIMNQVACISELVKLSQSEIEAILESASNAKLLYEFLHRKHNTVQPVNEDVMCNRKGWNKVGKRK